MERIPGIKNLPCSQYETAKGCSFSHKHGMACWKRARKTDPFLAHACIDCLVYLANHKNSILSQKDISNVIEQRKKNPPSHLIDLSLSPSIAHS